MSGNNEAGSGIGSLVPQFFFDIIARLIPGSVLIGVFSLAAMGPRRFWEVTQIWLNKPSDSYPSAILVGAAIAAVSYVLAIVLSGLWFLLSTFIEQVPTIRELIGNPENDSSTRYDFIRHKDASAGSRIAKIKAERHMTGVLAFGLILAFAINFFSASNWNDKPRITLGLSLLIAIVGAISAMSHFTITGRIAVKNHSEILGYKPALQETVLQAINENSISRDVSEASIDH